MFKFWKKKSVIEVLNQHLSKMTWDEKVDHLKTIIPMVCPNCHVSLNPKHKISEEVMETRTEA